MRQADNIKLLYIDLFCGAGGTSTGVEKATFHGSKCAKVIACVNHDANASQSRKLAEILPIESADMFLALNGSIPVMSKYIDDGLVTADNTAIPCWSLAALLGILHFPVLRYDIEDDEGGWIVSCEKNDKRYLSYYKDNPVDTCYEMIIKLHEQKLL